MTLSDQVHFKLFVESAGLAIESTVLLTGISDGFELYAYYVDVPKVGKPIILYDNVETVMLSSTTSTTVKVVSIEDLKLETELIFDIGN